MSDFKKIMVPLAFSTFSQDILQFAAKLAKPLDAELILINVINERDIETVQVITSFGYEVDEEHYLQQLQQQRIGMLEEMMTKVDFPEEQVRFVFKVGRPASTLLKFAVKEDVDMIVMGIKAKSELVHAFTGSVAEKLFRRSPVTIVSYRDEHNAGRLRKRILKEMDKEK